MVGKEGFVSDARDGRRKKQAAELLRKHGCIHTEGIGLDFIAYCRIVKKGRAESDVRNN